MHTLHRFNENAEHCKQYGIKQLKHTLFRASIENGDTQVKHRVEEFAAQVAQGAIHIVQVKLEVKV